MQHADVLAHLRAAVIVLDASGTIVTASGGVDSVLGYEMMSLVGRNALEFVAPDQQEEIASVFIDAEENVVRRFPAPFPVRVVADDGHIESMECLAAAVTTEDVLEWVLTLTPRDLQSFTYFALDRYVEGGDGCDVALAAARRLSQVSPEGFWTDLFVLADPVDGVFTSATAGDPSSPLVESLASVVARPEAIWNRIQPDAHVAVELADLPARLRRAAEAHNMEIANLGIVGIDGTRQIGLLMVASHRNSVRGNLRLVIDSALEVMSVAASRARAEEILRQAVERDPLTGLANRSGVVRALDERPLADGVAAIYLDVDRLKEVNDTYGHAVGDAVLVEVGRRISEVCRRDDVVARIGGDEFAVLLRDVDAQIAMDIAARIGARVAEALPIGVGPTHVSVSIGLALSDDREQMEELLDAADRAMLTGKHRRRNRHALVQQVTLPRVLQSVPAANA